MLGLLLPELLVILVIVLLIFGANGVPDLAKGVVKSISNFKDAVKDGNDEYLFDLSVDEREQANFREQNPTKFMQLRDEFKKWDATLLPRPPRRQR